jgi:rhodanese-related sulfurtransferase
MRRHVLREILVFAMFPRKLAPVRSISVTAVCLPVLFAVFASNCSGDDLSAVRSVLQNRIQVGRWTGQAGATCGIYAACRSLSLLGLEVDPGRYFTVEYIANSEGSTPAEVIKIVESQHCQAVPIVNLSKLDILLLGSPIIANVRATPSATAFDHWVCVLWENGRLLVFDGAAGPVEMSFADFLPMWNGYGIVVSHSAQLAAVDVWLARIGALFSFILVGVLCWRLTSWLPLPRVRAVARLSAACLALSLLGNLIFGDIVHAFHGVRVATASRETEFPQAGLTELRTAAAGREYVLIDARYRRDYEAGAIEGAISVPFNISDVALRGLFDRIDRDTPFLVYCQSESCGWNAVLADKLKSLGFRNVTVSNVGWMEYAASMRSSEDRSGATKTLP